MSDQDGHVLMCMWDAGYARRMRDVDVGCARRMRDVHVGCACGMWMGMSSCACGMYTWDAGCACGMWMCVFSLACGMWGVGCACPHVGVGCACTLGMWMWDEHVFICMSSCVCHHLHVLMCMWDVEVGCAWLLSPYKWCYDLPILDCFFLTTLRPPVLRELDLAQLAFETDVGLNKVVALKDLSITV
jgi:hypothetical protein